VSDPDPLAEIKARRAAISKLATEADAESITQADAEFITHAPADIDWLIFALAECRAGLDTAWGEIGVLQAACRDAGLVLFNMPATDDEHWYQRAKAVMNQIDEVVPGGIP
jgi:hypothetical protein